MTITLDHESLGLEDKQVLEMYRLMALARRMDDRMWALNRQGRAPFVVGSSGHEAIQVASAMASTPTTTGLPTTGTWEWRWPGDPAGRRLPRRVARKTDPMSGGRQLPNHWSTRVAAP